MANQETGWWKSTATMVGIIALLVVAGLVLATNYSATPTGLSTSQAATLTETSNTTVAYTTSTATTTTTEAVTCSGSLDVFATSLAPPVLIEPGSTVSVCVEYTDDFNQTFSDQAYAYVSQWTSSGLTPTHNVTVTASPADVNLTQGQKADVVYTITAGPDSMGFYGVYLLQICPPLPLAIGYPASAVSSSDFPGLDGPWGCPGLVVIPEILGYSNESSTTDTAG